MSVPNAPNTAEPGEIRRFDALADRWWDPKGPMAPLHRMNPARIGWIEARLGSLTGLHILDVGCGAGLAAEALAKKGAMVTGIDAAGAALAAARDHAAGAGLEVDYRETTPETLAETGARFDAVLALEVIEHVPIDQRPAFCAALAALVKPGGTVVLSTLNRTRRSWLFAIAGAEYVLRLLPRGTHDWKLFVTPAELGTLLRGAGLRPAEVAGLLPDPRTGGFRTGTDVAVNYMMAARA
ncbi:bifunctional 2-polyprenyl-6-hydroxyphenol methylase/3-demethylubiquinol 3-O-methyltransferase UbiG [Humitalea sp. 24SJ18S-53]|uniref:bifunctional 2-polyprenyl-6-hydroxyphenol methylase/3-demethylubiquinol 3-O-methyltransferase UbiG n=1 Tax=Humitalea sp. 24SJ18S-53 TaxID=3422307 RepID=UPI003D678B93